MPFMVIDGHNMKIDNNTFDAMNQFIQDDIQTSSEEEPRRQDPDYFKTYYLNKFKTPFTCPDCGTTISNNTNLSKHKNTKKCRNSQNFCWNIDLKPHSKSPQHLTSKKNLKNYYLIIARKKNGEGKTNNIRSSLKIIHFQT